MRRGARVGCATVASAVASVAAGVACYGPTEVRLEISTDLPCVANKAAGAGVPGPVHTLVRLGGAVDAPTVADTTACTEQAAADGFRDIGSIVLVPSGDRTARVTVQVSATADGSSPDACGRPETPPQVQAQCIVARRTFAFIKHTSRSLPIRLYAACRGQVCSAAETCNKFGTCESAVVNDMGCTASEGDCQAAPPATMPDLDASDAADDATPDAADASMKRLPCSAADGSNVLATGTPTDLVAVNSKTLFYVQAGPTGNGAFVWAIDTASLGAPMNRFAVPTGPGGVTAIAADESALWVGTPNTVFRYDLATGVPKPYSVASTRAIATAIVRPTSGTGTPSTTAFVATADIMGAAPVGSVYRLEPEADTPITFLVDQPGTQIAVSNGLAATAFVFTPALYGGPGLHRAAVGGGAPVAIKAGEPFGGMAIDATPTLFFAADNKIQRVDSMAAVPGDLYDVTATGLVAVDATSVFFEQKGQDSAIFRGGKGTGAGLAPAPRVATGYSDVQGLAVDNACVYFWSTTLAAFGTLNVYPKTRVAPGPAAVVHTP